MPGTPANAKQIGKEGFSEWNGEGVLVAVKATVAVCMPMAVI
jgi:hypothetical protein